MLAAALLTGCGAESGPTAENVAGLAADAVDHNIRNHIKLVEPFSEPLVNPCNGEVIVFSGEAVSQINKVGDLHFEFLTRASGTGTGPESGATYAYTVTAYESENRPIVDTPPATFGAGANARMISSIPGLTFTAHFQFHGVFLPSGEFKVTRDWTGWSARPEASSWGDVGMSRLRGPELRVRLP
jgi:hypothetical protein